ncbi:MAG: hypothetical protein ACK55I_01245 [bacterium]
MKAKVDDHNANLETVKRQVLMTAKEEIELGVVRQIKSEREQFKASNEQNKK